MSIQTSKKLELIDLSIAFSKGMPKYSAKWFPEFTFDEVAPETMTAADWKRRFTIVSLFAHNGTHVESSDHVFRDGKTIDRVPLQHFVGYPVLIDLTDIPNQTEISADLLKQRLAPLTIEEGEILLFHTGYDDREWGKEGFWDRSPWLSAEAAAYIASLNPVFIGLDFQTEKPAEKNFVVHKNIVSQGAVLCEYLFNLYQLDSDTLFVALPIKISDVEASPVRAIGIKGLRG
ncbi:cyclase family protein [Paenibacillus sp. CMAA1739]|uniref:cyclase family protein n=1 Tax=Paenibacillus ottowii TaxID=2315729 RepID=UPI002731AD60|nr:MULTISPECIES: cyclase family protein [Paenibacillus]MDP1512109.1 cyclase family protein [Paenibacillus ottowii]MEC4569082.1 cyclase family protein [Paenibacillus sp. CMAA1739]